MPTRAAIAATFDDIAAEFAATRRRAWPETSKFAALIPPGSYILDLGCGSGRSLVVLRDAGHLVAGLDASRGLLAFAAAKVGTGSLVHGDAVLLPFRSESFDAVHSIAAIHHMPSEDERRALLAECLRVLRTPGTLIVSAWAAEQRRFRLIKGSTDVHVPWWKPDGTAHWRFYHLFREGELVGLVSSAGFAIERAWRRGDNHVVLAAKR